MTTRGKWIWGTLGSTILITALLVFSFREALLVDAGKFMAPETEQMEGAADVVILEGTEFISSGMVSKGIELLFSGKARRMVVLLHRIASSYRPFALNEDYPVAVSKGLRSRGVKDSSFTIIALPVREPITLTAARDALNVLSRDGIKSAILVSPGFHTRRSYLVYQHLSVPLHIKIYPVACPDEYPLDTWWRDDAGVRDFVEEAQKLIGYLVMGYIPLKLSY